MVIEFWLMEISSLHGYSYGGNPIPTRTMTDTLLLISCIKTIYMQPSLASKARFCYVTKITIKVEYGNGHVMKL